MNPSLLAGIALVTVSCGCQSAGGTHARTPAQGATDAEKPDGAADWELCFALALVFPE